MGAGGQYQLGSRLVASPNCQHCGYSHAAKLERCPRTGLLMSEAGLCGTQLDRYLVERLLGLGGFGSVYLAHHARTKASVALKVLKPELMTNSSVLERFLREATTAASVGSEHVIRVFDAEVTSLNVAFIAMELLEGRDLKQLLKEEGRLHPARAVGLAMQVLRGLAAAHEKKVVHRDIKPGNIFITRRRDVHGREQELAKILDFGISKVTGAAALTTVGMAIGTPSYMAWEQFTDARAVDERTDLYAVAVMLWELLVGVKPFDGDSIPSLMNNVRIGEREDLRVLAPSLPVPLAAVVEKGLEKHRERRWQTAGDFNLALERTLWLLDAPPPLAPPPLDEPPPPTQVELPRIDEEKHHSTMQRRPSSQDETLKE